MSSPSEKLRVLSLAEMQNCKVYFRRDIKITNPRKLFRFLSNILSEMGYFITYNSVNIQRDPIGDTGAVDANIIAEKEHKLRYKVKKAHPIALIVGLIGIFFFLAGLGLENWGMFLFGIMLLVLGTYIFIKYETTETRAVTCYTTIYIKGVGEVYRGKFSKESKEKEIEQDQIITEMSLNLAGEVLPEINEVLRRLKLDIDFLLKRIDTFTE